MEPWSMGKFRALAPAPGKTWLRSAPAPGPCMETLLVYCCNLLQRHGPYTPQNLSDLAKKIKGIGCICDKS